MNWKPTEDGIEATVGDLELRIIHKGEAFEWEIEWPSGGSASSFEATLDAAKIRLLEETVKTLAFRIKNAKAMLES